MNPRPFRLTPCGDGSWASNRKCQGPLWMMGACVILKTDLKPMPFRPMRCRPSAPRIGFVEASTAQRARTSLSLNPTSFESATSCELSRTSLNLGVTPGGKAQSVAFCKSSKTKWCCSLYKSSPSRCREPPKLRCNCEALFSSSKKPLRMSSMITWWQSSSSPSALPSSPRPAAAPDPECPRSGLCSSAKGSSVTVSSTACGRSTSGAAPTSSAPADVAASGLTSTGFETPW
mmetsp:Transcript_2052/g.7963  ORF Transcript_2052/g.7963 Transcript_2052/m.7963 type:complete len:232 (-) Transcript_2052:3263-3958(-)